MPTQVSQSAFETVKKERDEALALLAKEREQRIKAEHAHAASESALRELMQRSGYKLKKEHVYAEDECRPLSLGEVCPVEKCGYDYRPDSQRFMMRPNDKVKETHPIK